MDIKQAISGLRIARDDLYRLATDGKDNFEIEAIKTAIYAMHELKEYKQLGTLEEVRAAAEKYSDIILCEECEYRVRVNGMDLHCCRACNGVIGYLQPGDGCSRGEKKDKTEYTLDSEWKRRVLNTFLGGR